MQRRQETLLWERWASGIIVCDALKGSGSFFAAPAAAAFPLFLSGWPPLARRGDFRRAKLSCSMEDARTRHRTTRFKSVQIAKLEVWETPFPEFPATRAGPSHPSPIHRVAELGKEDADCDPHSDVQDFLRLFAPAILCWLPVRGGRN